jgi:hypothetical protein
MSKAMEDMSLRSMRKGSFGLMDEKTGDFILEGQN